VTEDWPVYAVTALIAVTALGLGLGLVLVYVPAVLALTTLMIWLLGKD
jgi:hypothetical protein